MYLYITLFNSIIDNITQYLLLLPTLGIQIMASNEYLSMKEAAKYLGVSDVKMRRLIGKGLLKVSCDPLDDRKRLVEKRELDTLKKPRAVEAAVTQRRKQ
jgi:excisionase family DNA binding protein